LDVEVAMFSLEATFRLTKSNLIYPYLCVQKQFHSMITDINQLDLNKSYTYADYLTWQFDEMVELIKGKIYRMSPAPSNRHQDISSILHGELYSSLRKKPCQLRHAPFDVRFTRFVNDLQITTVVQPDICVVCDPSKMDERGCLGAPDFIIEILSPNTSHKDTHEKFYLYEESGVNEYWIVDPANFVLDVFVLEKGKYSFKGKFTKGDKVKLSSLPGLEMDLTDVFES